MKEILTFKDILYRIKNTAWILKKKTLFCRAGQLRNNYFLKPFNSKQTIYLYIYIGTYLDCIILRFFLN